jgi:hypothetical protein
MANVAARNTARRAARHGARFCASVGSLMLRGIRAAADVLGWLHGGARAVRSHQHSFRVYTYHMGHSCQVVEQVLVCLDLQLATSYLPDRTYTDLFGSVGVEMAVTRFRPGDHNRGQSGSERSVELSHELVRPAISRTSRQRSSCVAGPGMPRRAERPTVLRLLNEFPDEARWVGRIDR